MNIFWFTAKRTCQKSKFSKGNIVMRKKRHTKRKLPRMSQFRSLTDSKTASTLLLAFVIKVKTFIFFFTVYTCV
jgi:hypothetical protein